MRFTRDEVAASVAAEPGTAAEPTGAPLATLALSQNRAAASRAPRSDPPPAHHPVRRA